MIYLLDRKCTRLIKEHDVILLSSAVMGDAGRLYVAPDVVPVYQGMLSLASIITPNWFEVECVSVIIY